MDKIKKAIGSSIFWYQSIVYATIIILQLVYPKTSWLQMIFFAIVFLAILVLIIASGFKTTNVVTKTGEGTDPNKEEK